MGGKPKRTSRRWRVRGTTKKDRKKKNNQKARRKKSPRLGERADPDGACNRKTLRPEAPEEEKTEREGRLKG